MKKCSKCKLIKNDKEFRHRNEKNRYDELRSVCKKCEKIEYKIWYEKNKNERRKYKQQEWYKEYNKQYQVKYRDNHKKERAFLQRRRTVKKKKNGGKHTLKEWINKKREYNYCCAYCDIYEKKLKDKYKDKRWWKLTEDHIIPLKFGGDDNINNIRPACITCNTKKINLQNYV